ncbi:GIY-YIG nuclease family protein [Candidatus Falkowbacteria bacterium]|nr:GIY-YIG nuclease family protein [Candidatus Falkowbacteria bacterium]
MYSVYILKSVHFGRYYIGQTQNITDRLRSHNAGKNSSTRKYRPWQLVYREEYATRSEAMQREKYLKSLKKRVRLENIIQRSGVEQSGSSSGS